MPACPTEGPRFHLHHFQLRGSEATDGMEDLAAPEVLGRPCQPRPTSQVLTGEWSWSQREAPPGMSQHQAALNSKNISFKTALRKGHFDAPKEQSAKADSV